MGTEHETRAGTRLSLTALLMARHVFASFYLSDRFRFFMHGERNPESLGGNVKASAICSRSM